jgi:hypothetical protein
MANGCYEQPETKECCSSNSNNKIWQAASLFVSPSHDDDSATKSDETTERRIAGMAFINH